MNILAIETSCDDTCVAVIKASKKGFKVLSNIVSSQIEIHKKWGGVYPMLARREHQKNLAPVLAEALEKAKNPKIDLIAVTIGPGLEPCLWVGLNFAKALSYYWNLSLIPVNHIEAHILINQPKDFPALALIVSGGHTQLILVKNIGKYKLLGETRDDAAGECFDKIARILGLGYPGGPAIAKEAKGKSSITLPRPMINQKNYDFSFSGLKTAVLYKFKKRYTRDLAVESQQAIIDVLIKKTLKAARDYRVKAIILGGGVSANKELRRQLKQKAKGFKLLMPDFKYCTDNAVMTAITAYFKKPQDSRKLKPDANLRIC